MIHSESPSQSILMYSSYDKHQLRSNWGSPLPSREHGLKGHELDLSSFSFYVFLWLPSIFLLHYSQQQRRRLHPLLLPWRCYGNMAVAGALIGCQENSCIVTCGDQGGWVTTSQHSSSVCLHLALVQYLVQCKAFQLNGCRWIPNVC